MPIAIALTLIASSFAQEIPQGPGLPREMQDRLAALDKTMAARKSVTPQASAAPMAAAQSQQPVIPSMSAPVVSEAHRKAWLKSIERVHKAQERLAEETHGQTVIAVELAYDCLGLQPGWNQQTHSFTCAIPPAPKADAQASRQ